MPIDLAASIEQASAKVFGSSKLRTFIGGTFGFAFLITALMLLIVLFTCPAPFSRSATFCLFMYMLIPCTFLFSLHDSVVRKSANLMHRDAEADEVVGRGVHNRDTIYGSYEVLLPSSFEEEEAKKSAAIQVKADEEFRAQTLEVEEIGIKAADAIEGTRESHMIGGAIEGGNAVMTGMKPPHVMPNPYS